jgi:hypothetical protein
MGSNWITAEIVGSQGVAVVGTTVVIIEKVETCWEEAGNTQSRRSHRRFPLRAEGHTRAQ